MKDVETVINSRKKLLEDLEKLKLELKNDIQYQTKNVFPRLVVDSMIDGLAERAGKRDVVIYEEVYVILILKSFKEFLNNAYEDEELANKLRRLEIDLRGFSEKEIKNILLELEDIESLYFVHQSLFCEILGSDNLFNVNSLVEELVKRDISFKITSDFDRITATVELPTLKDDFSRKLELKK